MDTPGSSAPADQASSGPMLSVIIPVLNEAGNLANTLSAMVDSPQVKEVLVVDGGSTDRTAEIALHAGARVIECDRSRGLQLAAGAAEARGDVFWFVHGDTVPAPGTVAAVSAAMTDPDLIGGNCTVGFDGERKAARFLTWLYPHLRKIGLVYGDSGIFVRKAVYDACGGFRAFPLFEDVDLVRRLRRHGRLVTLPAVVGTSSRRFEKRSFALTFAFWSGLQVFYWCGVSPKRLGRLYYLNQPATASDEELSANEKITPSDHSSTASENRPSPPVRV